MIEARKPASPVLITQEQEFWSDIYKRYFGTTLDFSGVYIPELPDDDLQYRMNVVRVGLMSDEAYRGFEKIAHVWKYTDFPDKSYRLDTEIRANARFPDKTYVFWVLDQNEPECLGDSVISSDPNRTEGLTVTEGIIDTLGYLARTGKSLGIDGVHDHAYETFCSATKLKDGGVMRIYYDSLGKACIDWHLLEYTDPLCGIRRPIF